MEMEEIAKLLIAVLVLVILIGATIFLLSEKGSAVLESVKSALRFGR